ncbi:MAG: peptide chain release factor N(5)-glutamine methyltransferase [Microscillaceae bacterium]|nr:peptide chain release factor N(5)-glutamine methyltransferase [Microscillaceae bacterium]
MSVSSDDFLTRQGKAQPFFVALRKWIVQHAPFYAEAATPVAFQLIQHFTGLEPTQVLANVSFEMNQEERAGFHQALRRLTRAEPLAYILEEAFFSGLRLKIAPGVLIPRPETEEMVQKIIQRHRLSPPSAWVDVGTGSGAIALSLANHFRQASGWALDISPQALDIARENAFRLSLPIHFRQYDLRNSPLPEWPVFDLLVSNPPYVCESEKIDMQANVLHYEPDLALFVPDEDPLYFYRLLALFTQTHLAKGGVLYWEINERFGDETKDLLLRHQFEAIEIHTDFRGKARFVVARKPLDKP